MMRNEKKKKKKKKRKNGYLAAILKRYNILFYSILFLIYLFFWQNYDFFIVPTYMVPISLQNFGETSVFLRNGSMNPPLPWAPAVVKVPWSVKG